MRLADFIEQNHLAILDEWDKFAATLSGASGLDHQALRNHAAQMLMGIVEDMRADQDVGDRRDKSHGAFDMMDESAATLSHGSVRELQGINVNGLFAEFRALRSAVCRLWGSQPRADTQSLDDLIRFDEALDKAVTESLTRFQERLTRRRSLILGTLAHDLRNPLGVVLMTSRALRRRGGPGADPRALDLIARNAQRAERIVQDLFDMLLASGRSHLPVQPVEVDLVTVCKDVIDEARVMHPGAQISFCGPETVVGAWDAGRLCRAASNLVENAVRHGEGSPITVALHDAGDVAVLRIGNGGEPIPPEFLRLIFQPLTQAPPSAGVSNASGAGLGLYIAREIASAHAGSLEVESNEEVGTLFTLRLPKRAPQAAVR